MRRPCAGFTWIELLLVLAVLAILAALAIPGMQDSTLKRQVKDGFALGDVAKKGVEAAYALTGTMPADNAAAGLPAHDKIVGNLVKDVNVSAGAVTLTYGNNASRGIEGRRVTFRPAVIADEPQVPIAWICHDLRAPAGMELKGSDLTDVPPNQLPVECRGGTGK
jgi:type IV pilus assembly protein PilA